MERKKPGIIDEEEAKRIGIIPAGRGCWVRLQMRELEVGKYLLVPRSDWNRSSKTPNDIVKDENQKGGKRYEMFQTADKEGWLIKRIA